MLKIIFRVIFWLVIGWIIWLAIEVFKSLKVIAKEEVNKEDDNDTV